MNEMKLIDAMISIIMIVIFICMPILGGFVMLLFLIHTNINYYFHWPLYYYAIWIVSSIVIFIGILYIVNLSYFEKEEIDEVIE